ncbi:MAG: phosphoribosylamine-glycine ligase, phosphoribosylamine-glycine ligase [Candidatus Gottesmanbacteria bacterium GW2011_GWA2_43_14]|uniref:Phosphoribosylamine--glycine ligase n=1 Tax=Candidatus Gottesmanbacteria bacterium GW2011_GWA2_43_14 TaxID=1618443 RepID=A0A0G1DLM3_9BACT|nr:MAG: phosphoribosylamine-glycine ligase, phosphoribosylamine-glycine ligase [Candidatus Gottesmanbacteria bacterium GW2011_GWA2_43_14]
MKLLVIGSGGREHALVWKLSQSRRVSKIYCLPGNAGTGLLAENADIPIRSIKKILQFVKEKKIDLTLVGPEAPLIAGLSDLFRQNKLLLVGPSKAAARLEGSKVYAKNLMRKYGIPTAKYAVFKNLYKARRFARLQTFPLVIKADGQCFGKGVAVCKSYSEASNFLEKILKKRIFGSSGSKVIIEECLSGQEVSFMAATDGFNFVTLLPCQDHKRARDGDRGPNTGGIGAYAPIPFLNKETVKMIEKTIIAPTIKAMREEGKTYQGILYPGLILTELGPYVLEYNCRFGDPETQPLMMLMKTDLMEVLLAITGKKVGSLKMEWRKGYSACVILTAKGYPGKYLTDMVVNEPKKTAENLQIFYAGAKREMEQIVTTGGRVMAVCSYALTLGSAIDKAYDSIGQKDIYFKNMQYRKDIGQKGLQKKLWENLE